MERPAAQIDGPAPEAVLIEMRQIEARIAERLESHTKAADERERSSMEGLHGLRAELSFAIAQLAVLRDQSAGSSERVDAVGERTIRRFEDAMSTIGSRLSELEQAVKSGTQRIEKMEQSLDSLDQAAAEVRDSVTRDLLNFERAFKQQAAAIESTRTAVSQTDDLVERVVEALESLQGVIMERAESNELPAARAS